MSRDDGPSGDEIIRMTDDTKLVPARPATETAESLIAVTEASLIGSLLMHGVEKIDLGRLSGRHFSAGVFGKAFDAIKARGTEGKPITPFALVRDLEGAISAADAIKMASSSMPLVFAEGYAEDIYHHGTMRLIAAAATGGRLSEVEQLTKDLQTETREVETVDTRLGRMFETLHDVADGKKVSEGAPTGLIDLDRYIGGLVGGDMVIIAGRPGMGKSTLASAVAMAAARAGHPVLFRSIEMTTEQVYQRMSCDLLWDRGERIPYTSYRSGRLTHRQINLLAEAAWEIRSWPMEIVDGAGTIRDIGAGARAWFASQSRKTTKTGVLIVDYLGIVQPDDRYKGNKVNEIAEISAGGKAIAKELGICSILLSQLSRNVESRDDKRPMLSDLRDSGAIEQDADSVIFAYRDAYYLEKALEGEPDHTKKAALMDRIDQVKHQIELIVAKNRHGPTGTVRAYCEIEYAAIRNQARDEGRG